jgi:hypothetical protein
MTPANEEAGRCETCGSTDQADSGQCRDRFHRSIIDLVNAPPAPQAVEMEVLETAAERLANHSYRAEAAALRDLAVRMEAMENKVTQARLIMERACPWFQIQEVAHPKLGAKANAIWVSMQRWLAYPAEHKEKGE